MSYINKDEESLPSWVDDKKPNKIKYSRQNTSFHNEPATKKTKSEPKEEEEEEEEEEDYKPINEDRGLFSDEKMKKANETGLFQHVVGIPPRPVSSSRNPTSNTSSPKRGLYRSPNKVLSPLLGGPKPHNSPYVYHSSPDSQFSVFSHSSGLTGLTGRSQKSEHTSSFTEMQNQMEQQQKDIEIWKQIVNKKESNLKKLKKALTKLDDHNNTFEYKKGIMAQYLSDSDTSGSDASPEQEEEEIKKIAAEEEEPDDNLKDVFNDEKSESDSEPTPDAIINFTENLTNLQHFHINEDKI